MPIAYKMFRVNVSKKGQLFPLFVDYNNPVPIGQWIEAKFGEKIDGKEKVKSKLGPLAFRPGWHLADIPLAIHIGIKGETGKIEYMNPDYVWCECEYIDDINYQKEANNNGLCNNKIIAKKSYLKNIPINGYYRYKTSPSMLNEWIIAGNIKINKVLTDDEVETILKEKNYLPMKRFGGDIDLKKFGF